MAVATKKKKGATKKKKSTKANLQPLGARIVVRRDEVAETTAGGLVLPTSAAERPTRGVIVSVGNGKILANGTRGEMQLKEGDHILFTSYAPNEIKFGDEELLLMLEEDVLAVIE